MSSALGLGSAVLSFMGNELTNQTNITAQRENMALQHYYNELSANNADQRTRALYNDLYSPSAQVSQLKASGLSPSIYSSSGLAGKQGVSGAQGQGVGLPTFQSADYSSFGRDLLAGVKADADIAVAQAQKDNIEADTEAKRIAMANDPTVGEYMRERIEAENQADSDLSDSLNRAWVQTQQELTHIEGWSDASNWTLQRSESRNGSSGYSYYITDGSSSGNGWKCDLGRFGVGYGEQESGGHNEGEGQSENMSFGRSLSQMSGHGESKSGNNRKAEDVLRKFANHCTELYGIHWERMQKAQRNYEKRVQSYHENYNKHSKKSK